MLAFTFRMSADLWHTLRSSWFPPVTPGLLLPCDRPRQRIYNPEIRSCELEHLKAKNESGLGSDAGRKEKGTGLPNVDREGSAWNTETDMVG